MHDYLNLEETQVTALMRLIDRMHKMPLPEFFAAIDILLSPSQRESRLGQQLAEILAVKNLEELPEIVRKQESSLKLQKLIDLFVAGKVTNAIFDITLMRGFDYYTDIVFEVFDTDPENNRSMFGGGRYDGLVGLFGVEPVATVGFGMGDVTMLNFLKIHNLLPDLKPETDVNVILIGDVYAAAQPILKLLRKESVRVSVDTTGRKLDKQLKSAARSGVRYALFIGENELKENRFKLKDLNSGKEEEHAIERTIAVLAAEHSSQSDEEL